MPGWLMRCRVRDNSVLLEHAVDSVVAVTCVDLCLELRCDCAVFDGCKIFVCGGCMRVMLLPTGCKNVGA